MFPAINKNALGVKIRKNCPLVGWFLGCFNQTYIKISTFYSYRLHLLRTVLYQNFIVSLGVLNRFFL